MGLLILYKNVYFIHCIFERKTR